MSRKYIESQI